jgi:hypothetical protein
LLVAVYVTCVSWFVATTSTFGTETPSLLVTVPVTLAKCVCACSETQPAANAHVTSTAIHRFFMNRLLRDVLSRLAPGCAAPGLRWLKIAGFPTFVKPFHK